MGESLGEGVSKKISSEADIHASSQVPKLLPRSQSHKSPSECESPNARNLTPSQKESGQTSQGYAQKIKITYGDEKFRFRIQNNWSYPDLLLEIARRFNIDDLSRYDIKYLDDDAEWILLTCDADLEECLDVCRSSQSCTIKLSLQVSHHHSEKSLGTSGPA